MVKKHLSEKYVVLEEDLLERIADSSEKGTHHLTQHVVAYVYRCVTISPFQ